MGTPTEHAVLLLVSRRVQRGRERELEAACLRLIEAASRFDGYLGAQLVSPGDTAEVGDPLFHVIMAFNSRQNLERWQGSSERAQRLAATDPYVDGPTQVQHIGGLADWFKPAESAPTSAPPRWKVAAVTWLGIFPTVYLLFVLLDPLLRGWPLPVRVLVLTILVVALMTWLVAPWLSRRFQGWLYRS